MNETQRGIITLVQSAITGKALPLPEGFDIEEAYPMIVRHQLMTLAYTGAVQCGISKDLPVMQQLFQTYCRCLMRVEGQMHEVKRIFAAFDENDIDYLPLKGCKINVLYPAPELRLMGDADILIRTEQYKQIRPIMQELGFAEGNESDHELLWDSKALHVELHKRLIPAYNEDYCTFFENCWELAKRVSGGRHELSHEEEFLYLFGHFLKHYRNGGIGCRQLIDLWVYRNAFPDMDEAYIRQRLAEMHFVEFYQNILRTIDVWFAGAPEDPKSDFITEYIFQSGSWGSMDSYLISNAAKIVSATGTNKHTKLKNIWFNIFPGVSRMRHNYPILEKAPFLLPIFWPVRWVDAVLFRRKNIARGYRSVQIVTPDKIENFQQALQYVGLGFGK